MIISTLAACDSDGIGAFSRTIPASAALLGSISEDGRLTVEEVELFTGTDEPLILRDPFEYGLEPGRSYWMIVAPSVESHRDPDRGAGQFSVLYLHDPVTDLPVDTFPDSKTDSGRSPEEFLDCLREDDEAAVSRFDALARAVQVGFDELSACT